MNQSEKIETLLIELEVLLENHHACIFRPLTSENDLVLRITDESNQWAGRTTTDIYFIDGLSAAAIRNEWYGEPINNRRYEMNSEAEKWHCASEPAMAARIIQQYKERNAELEVERDNYKTKAELCDRAYNYVKNLSMNPVNAELEERIAELEGLLREALDHLYNCEDVVNDYEQLTKDISKALEGKQ